MSESEQGLPFKRLGERLKIIRQKLHESVAEVSGAVEIDEPMLRRIEQGHERPSEDVLMLLISHFGMHEDEASGLWQLAGYERPDTSDYDTDDIPHQKSTILVMAVDPRIMYSDQVHITGNKNGIVISFSQATGNNAPIVTSRVGMSREQAETVLQALQDALAKSTPRQLPDGSNSAGSQNKPA